MTEVTKEEVEKLVEKIAAGKPVEPIKEAPGKVAIPMKAPDAKQDKPVVQKQPAAEPENKQEADEAAEPEAPVEEAKPTE